MKIDDLIDAIGEIKPEYVKEAAGKIADSDEEEKALDNNLASDKKKRRQGKGRQNIFASKKVLTIIASAAACVCLVVAMRGTGLLQLKMENTSLTADTAGAIATAEDTNESAIDADESAMDSAFGAESMEEAAPESALKDDLTGESDSPSNTQNSQGLSQNVLTNMVINELDAPFAYVEKDMGYATKKDLSMDEWMAYYQPLDYASYFPTDLIQNTGNTQYLLFDKENNVIYDRNHDIYQNGTGDRGVTVTLSIVSAIGETADWLYESFTANGTEMTLLHYTDQGDEHYLAIFEKNNVQYAVDMKNLYLEEWQTILSGCVQ